MLKFGCFGEGGGLLVKGEFAWGGAWDVVEVIVEETAASPFLEFG